MAQGENPFGMVRRYHKQSAQSGQFGPNWFSSFDYKLGWVKNDTAENFDDTPMFSTPGGKDYSRAAGKDGTMYLLLPDGSLITLGSQQPYPSSSGTYAYRPKDNTKGLMLLEFSNGEYTLTLENNDVVTLSNNGRVLSKVDQYGVGWTVDWGDGPAPFAPASVTDSAGRTIKFTWNASYQLTTVTDPAGTQYSYAYNGTSKTSMLTSETRPGSPSNTVSYVYEDSTNPTGVTGKFVNGARYGTYAYNPIDGSATNFQGWVKSSGMAGSAETLSFSYSYGTVNGKSGGQYTTVTNSQGATATYAYIESEWGKPLLANLTQTGITNSSNTSSTTTYDSNYRTSTTVDNNGNQTNYNYNVAGQLVQVISGINANNSGKERITNYTWDTVNNRITSIITQVNKAAPVSVSETDYVYYPAGDPAAGRVHTTTTINRSAYGTSSQQLVTTYTYQVQSNKLLSQVEVTSSAYGSAGKVDYNFDSSGNPTSIVNGLGQSTSYSGYNALGRPGTVTDPNGLATSFSYDTGGRVVQTQQVVGGVTRTYRYAYNGFDKPTSITYPTGRIETYTYDAADRLVASTSNYVNSFSASGGTVNETYTQNYSYTSLSRVSEYWLVATDSGARSGSSTYLSQFFDYDSLGRRTGVRGNNGQDTKYSYDSNGNVLTITDALNRVTQKAYNAFNEVTSVTDPNGKTSSLGYDGAGHLSSMLDPRGLTTTYVYDGLGNLVQLSSPDTGTTQYAYANSANLSTLTRNDGSTVTFSVDALGRVYQETAGTQSRTYSYDTCTYGVGHLCKITDSSGSTVYTYTQAGKLNSQASTIGSSTYNTSLSYDVMDRVASMTYPDTSLVTYQYTQNSPNVSSISATISGTLHTVASNLNYLGYGPLQGLTYGNGLAQTRSYDKDLRLNSLVTGGVQSMAYSFDAANQLNQITNNVYTTQSATYTYDGLSRLTNVTSAGGNESITPDAAGNRTAYSSDGYNDTYNINPGNNQISSITGGRARSYTYDALGNLHTESGWGGAYTYTYDGFNTLTSLNASGSTTSYSYNALGQRASKSGAGGAFAFVYTPGGKLLAETAANTSSIGTEYIWLGNETIGLIQNGNLFYMHNDHLARSATVTNASGAVVWQAVNTAFGQSILSHSITLNMGFPGQYYDAESGLYYNGARYYDSTIGRYIQSDPVGLVGGINTYVYALGNPLSYIDTAGTSTWGVTAATLGAGAAITAIGAAALTVVAAPEVAAVAAVYAVTSAVLGAGAAAAALIDATNPESSSDNSSNQDSDPNGDPGGNNNSDSSDTAEDDSNSDSGSAGGGGSCNSSTSCTESPT